MNRGPADDWNRRIPGSLPVIPPLPEGEGRGEGEREPAKWNIVRSPRFTVREQFPSEQAMPMNRGPSGCWNHRMTLQLATILPLPKGVAMTISSPPGMKLLIWRSLRLPTRWDRLPACLFFPSQGIFTVVFMHCVLHQG